MGRSTTRYTTFRRLKGTGEIASTILRLMMACNDLMLTDNSLATWKDEQRPQWKLRGVGAAMYFIRVQIAHLFEAFSIIEDISGSAKLTEALAACDGRTQQSFQRVSDFIGSADYKKMRRIRNNLTFHYDAKVVEAALNKAAIAHPDVPFRVSMGDATIDWFFEPADRIIDRMVVRDIFAVPEGVDVRVETDNIIARLQEVAKTFADFAGYFIWHHIRS